MKLTPTFTKRWIADPAVWPLFGAIGAASLLVIVGAGREFMTNPRYTILPARRRTVAVHETEAEATSFVNNPLIPHAKQSFSLFPFTFKPVNDMMR